MPCKLDLRLTELLDIKMLTGESGRKRNTGIDHAMVTEPNMRKLKPSFETPAWFKKNYTHMYFHFAGPGYSSLMLEMPAIDRNTINVKTLWKILWQSVVLDML